MNAQAPRPLRARHRAWLVTAVGSLACALVLATACAVPGVSKPASSHECTDKLVQELATNTTAKGLWACLDSTLQQTLNAYGVSGDAAFVNPGRSATPAGLVTTHYAAQQNGVAIYTAVIKSSDPQKPAVTLVIVVWVNPDGKIANLTVASPDL